MIKPRIPALLLGAFVLASCNQEKSADTGSDSSATQTAPVPAGSIAVTAAQPSPHFQAVMSRIDVGGKILHYKDHEGRREFWIGLAELVMDLARSQGGLDLPASFDVASFIDGSGMMDMAATGRSISRDGDNWLMKQFSIYRDEPSEMAAMLGKLQPFALGTRLPAGTDVALEMRGNTKGLPASMRHMARLMGQAEEVEEALATELPLGMSLEQLYGLAEAHVLIGIELKDTGEEAMPVMPDQWVMQITTHRKIVAGVQPMLTGMMGEPKAIGGDQGWEMPEAPLPGMGKPVVVVRGEDTLIAASSADYLSKLDADGGKLGEDKRFQSATNHFPKSGHLLAYVSPEVPAAARKWMQVVTAANPDMEPLAAVVRKLTPDKPWSLCMAADEQGIELLAEMPFALDADSTTMMVALGGTSTLFVGARAWKKGSDRAATILNIRNCQQAMRGHQNLNNLKVGDPFTRKDLEEYIDFPEDIKVSGGWIRFEAGDTITPVGELWLKVSGPGMDGAIGDHGFEDASAYEDW